MFPIDIYNGVLHERKIWANSGLEEEIDFRLDLFFAEFSSISEHDWTQDVHDGLYNNKTLWG